MERWAWFTAIVTSACYSPNHEIACTVTCTDTPCPSHLTCTAGLCVDPATGMCPPTPIDAPMDGGLICVGTEAGPFLKICVPETALKILGSTLNTDTPDDCDKLFTSAVTGGQEVCIVFGTQVQIPIPLRVTGTRPLVIVATDVLTVKAPIDAAGRAGKLGERPPGSQSSACSNLTRGANGGAMGGGGGAGGGFVTIGGRGGNGNGLAMGAQGNSSFSPMVFRGGCNGSEGGDGLASGTTGPGGLGGGAIYLMARTRIDLGSGAQIDASGGGGLSPKAHGGGSGGGSGGMIILDAPTIMGADAVPIFAIGGGGSSGGTTADGLVGGDPADETAAGAGGNNPGTQPDGDGGAGGSRALGGTAGKDGDTNGGGGGGGGGGVGSIQIRTTSMISGTRCNPTPIPQ